MGRKKSLYKGDIVIIGLVLLAALIGFFMPITRQQADNAGAMWASPPTSVEIFVDGQLYETIALAAGEHEIRLESNGGYNLLRIAPEGITMLAADCHNQDCVQVGTQDQPGSMIACLPHRVLVRLSNNGAGGVDAIAY